MASNCGVTLEKGPNVVDALTIIHSARRRCIKGTAFCLGNVHCLLQKALSTHGNERILKFIYSEKATKFFEIFILLLTGTKAELLKV